MILIMISKRVWTLLPCWKDPGGDYQGGTLVICTVEELYLFPAGCSSFQLEGGVERPLGIWSLSSRALGSVCVAAYRRKLKSGAMCSLDQTQSHRNITPRIFNIEDGRTISAKTHRHTHDNIASDLQCLCDVIIYFMFRNWTRTCVA